MTRLELLVESLALLAQAHTRQLPLPLNRLRSATGEVV
jgi:hypothetical protein